MSSSKSMKDACLDKGHRVGNFHNYYEFNPADNRLKIMEKCGILRYLINDVFISCEDDHIREKKRTKIDKAGEEKKTLKESAKRNELLYCDLGCNEGDLTLALGNTIMAKTSNPMLSLHCLGLDIDKELIKRAKFKNKQQNGYAILENKDKSSIEVRYIEEAEFDACDFNNNDELLLKSKAYLARFEVNRFRLISVFSTTMWIHIHGGDEGLVNFFKRICSMTEYLLLEPQPSKCYRNVNVRLRKLGRPEVDVSTERLQLRENIEIEVDRILKDCGFDKVDISHQADTDTKENTPKKDETNRTVWKRKLQLYRRCDSQ